MDITFSKTMLSKHKTSSTIGIENMIICSIARGILEYYNCIYDIHKKKKMQVSGKINQGEA